MDDDLVRLLAKWRLEIMVAIAYFCTRRGLDGWPRLRCSLVSSLQHSWWLSHQLPTYVLTLGRFAFWCCSAGFWPVFHQCQSFSSFVFNCVKRCVILFDFVIIVQGIVLGIWIRGGAFFGMNYKRHLILTSQLFDMSFFRLSPVLGDSQNSGLLDLYLYSRCEFHCEQAREPWIFGWVRVCPKCQCARALKRLTWLLIIGKTRSAIFSGWATQTPITTHAPVPHMPPDTYCY